jgi:enamine deaminase RidA (YjgF/YER057c/UK114 family)
MLALVRRELGSLNSVKRILKLDVHIACGADFRDLGKVADGASELLTQIFGKYGTHARMCVGVTSLPGNACVMLNVEVETN